MASTLNFRSLSSPTVKPPSLTTPNVPVVVSFAFDLRKVEAASPPNASESVDVPWNFRSDIAVDKVIPFLIVVKPDTVSYTHLTLPTTVSV